MKIECDGRVLAAAAIAAPVGVVAAFNRYQKQYVIPESEVHEPFPGDDLVAEEGASTTTMAIEIDASPSAVWPHLNQLGQDKAGFYSFSIFERAVHFLIDPQHLRAASPVAAHEGGGLVLLRATRHRARDRHARTRSLHRRGLRFPQAADAGRCHCVGACRHERLRLVVGLVLWGHADRAPASHQGLRRRALAPQALIALPLARRRT